jgi:hypothetical protein
MSVIVFPNSSLSSIACAQFLLDGQPSLSIHLISNSFEVGLMRETPGLITNDQWPLVRPHWLSEHGLEAPAGGSTAIRASWLTKSMAISLSERGATFHTGSRILETNEESKTMLISIPGEETSKTIQYDVIIEMPDPAPKREWRGAVCSEVPDWAVSSGRRTDGTYEFWWTGTEEPVNAIQTMSWMGPSPSTALLDAITEASRASDTILTGSMPA